MTEPCLLTRPDVRDLVGVRHRVQVEKIMHLSNNIAEDISHLNSNTGPCVWIVAKTFVGKQ